MTAPLDAGALRAAPLVATLELHDQIGSTNDRAKELVAAEATLPALVVAERQTAGRGRGAHQWWAGEGALTFSLAVDTTAFGLGVADYGLVSLATAVAVVAATDEVTGLPAQVKWPNDVLLEGRKLAGVLLESPRPGRLIIGGGINVGNRFDGAPAEVRSRAVSLREATGGAVSRQAVLLAFLDAMAERLGQLANNDLAPLEAVRSVCWLTGKHVTLVDAGRRTTGRCRGIADDGALLLEVNDPGAGPRLAAFHSGSIESVSDSPA